MKFTQIPADTFKQLQMNAGILLDGFTPSTGVIGNIIGASTGGISFEATPTFSDFGEDIDNCPKNMMELKKLESWEAKLSGTFVTVTAASAKMLVGAADMDAGDATHIIPRRDVLLTDFTDVWWVGDYSDNNGNLNGGFCAIHLMNALSTGGFKIKSADKAKGTFGFEFTGHFSMNAQETVPFEIYIQEGTSEFEIAVTSAEGTLSGDTKITVSYTLGTGESFKYKTGASVALPSENDDLSTWTAWDGTSEITATDGDDIVVAVVATATARCKKAGKTEVEAKA